MTALELDPLRIGPAQRVLAERHDPLADQGRHRGRDSELHRRLLEGGPLLAGASRDQGR